MILEERLAKVLIALIGARWLGHGRRMEGYLVLVAGFGTLILCTHPLSAEFAHSLESIFWMGYGKYIFIPYLAVFVISGYGLVGNKFDWPSSRWARFIGATLGFLLWITYSVQLYHLNLIATPGFILGFPLAVYGELGVMIASAANVPRPGAPGNMGQ